ncbi:MAG: tellurite resistance TerB family protein [Thiohalobacterales bacterium]|nr:tellurite resistance TerB family protein [Thiohalobacterales bacterium]
MFNAKQMLSQYLEGQTASSGENPVNTGNLRGLAGGALAGGLTGLLAGTKTGRKIGKHALVYGGTALVGGLAYKAWRDWQDGKAPGAAPPPAAGVAGEAQPAVPPPGSTFLPSTEQQQDELGRALVRAMIGAAKADGRIDPDERQRIEEQVAALGLDEGMRSFVHAELAGPLNIDAIVAPAVCEETAAEIYAASLMAIDSAGTAEEAYLALLAARLNLAPGLVSHLQANVEAARPHA